MAIDPRESSHLSRRAVLRWAVGAAGAMTGTALMAACGAATPTAIPTKPAGTAGVAGQSQGAAPQVPTAVAGGATPATGGAQPTLVVPAVAGTPTIAPKPAVVGSPVGAATSGAATKPAGGASPAASAATKPAAGATPAAAKPGGTPAALPKPGDMPAGSFMKTIQDRGKLVAGVKTDVRLFGYLNPRTNKIEGFDVDILKEVARAIFGDPEKIELKEVTSASRIPSLKEGVVDIVAATMTITKARLEEIDFSNVYYESAQLVLVPKSSAIKSINDTAGKKVCAAKGSTSEKNIAKAQPKAEVVQADKYTDCLIALQQGRADAISTDDVILAGLAETDPNLVIVGEPFSQEPYGLGIAKGKEGFVPFVNGVLTQIKDSGKWAEIHKQWLGKYIQTPAPPRRTAQEAAV